MLAPFFIAHGVVTCEKMLFWTVCCTVTFINVLIFCFFTLLAWLGFCMMFCIILPYFVTCMSVAFASVIVFIKQSYLLDCWCESSAYMIEYGTIRNLCHPLKSCQMASLIYHVEPKTKLGRKYWNKNLYNCLKHLSSLFISRLLHLEFKVGSDATRTEVFH